MKGATPQYPYICIHVIGTTLPFSLVMEVYEHGNMQQIQFQRIHYSIWHEALFEDSQKFFMVVRVVYSFRS